MIGTPKWINEIGYYDNTDYETRRILLYGDSGAGKTHFIGTCPDPFVIDIDRGGRTLRKLKIPFILIERKATYRVFERIMEVIQAVKGKNPPFDKIDPPRQTLAIDSVTALADCLLADHMLHPSNPKTPPSDPDKIKASWENYGVVQNRLKTIIKFCQDIGLNLVCTAGTKLEKDEVLGTFVGKPNIVGGYRDLIHYDFDEVYFLDNQVSKDSKEYSLYTARYRYFEGKTREGLQYKYTDPSWDKLFK
jgi:hypothetical protein